MLDQIERLIVLPEGLDTLPPGPELAALIDIIDVTRCMGHQLVEVIRAQARMECHAQAERLVVAAELARVDVAMNAGPLTRSRVQINKYAFMETAFALTVSEHTAHVLVDAALLAVETAPALLAAMRAGRLDFGKLKMIQTEVRELSDEQVRVLVDRLAPEFDVCTCRQLRDKLRTLLLAIDPAAVRRRREKALDDRRVRHDQFANGTCALTGSYLPADKVAAAWDYLESIVRATARRGDPLGRTLDQLRADVYLDLLAGVDPVRAGYATPAERKGSIHLHIGFETLACLSDEPGRLDGFAPVAADIARETTRQLCDTADWAFVVHDQDQSVVAAGRLPTRPDPRRFPTLRQRRYLNARDRTCRAPGCEKPARRCDIDHVHDHAKHGPTHPENLCALCPTHHRAKHKGGFRITRLRHGLRWRTPQGQEYFVLHPDADTIEATRTAMQLHAETGQIIYMRR